MKEMQRAGYGERGQSFHALSGHTILFKSASVYQPRSSSNPILLGFMEASLHRHDRLHHWPLATELNLQPLSLLQSSGGGTESFNLLISRLVPLATNLPLKVTKQLSKSHLITIIKDTFIAFLTGNSKGLRSSATERGTKTKYMYFFL